MKPLLLLAFAALASAQTFPSQQVCPSSAKFGPVVALPAGYQQFVYGSISCDVMLPNGTYPVQIATIENRSASGSDGAVGRGVRVFSFTINGASTGALDPFASAAAQMPLVTSPAPVAVTTGVLHIQSVPQAGNPILVAVIVGPCQPCAPLGIQPLQVSDIGNVTGMVVQLADGTTRLVPLGVLAIVPTGPVPTVQLAGPSVADWKVCSGSGKQDCSGINYVALRKVDGSQVKLAAVPFPPSVQVAPPNWSPVN